MNAKTDSDSNYAASYSESVLPFAAPNKSASKLERMRDSKDRKRELKQTKNTAPMFSAEMLEREIINQIWEAEKAIDSVDKLLPARKYKAGKVEVEDLRLMEQSIRRKNLSIREIEEEIKLLKGGIFYDQKKSTEGCPSLSSEIKKTRESLNRHEEQLRAKLQQANSKREAIRSIEEKFKAKCRQEGIEPITFEEFKQMQNKKKKEQTRVDKLKKIPSAKRYNPQLSNVKEIPERDHSRDMRNPENHHSSPDSKKMKDLLQKKNVTQAALKNAKKRHNLEMNDLMGKLQFLKDEYQELQAKLSAKEQELKMAENKFSESRSQSEKRFLIKRTRGREH